MAEAEELEGRLPEEMVRRQLEAVSCLQQASVERAAWDGRKVMYL